MTRTYFSHHTDFNQCYFYFYHVPAYYLKFFLFDIIKEDMVHSVRNMVIIIQYYSLTLSLSFSPFLSLSFSLSLALSVSLPYYLNNFNFCGPLFFIRYWFRLISHKERWLQNICGETVRSEKGKGLRNRKISSKLLIKFILLLLRYRTSIYDDVYDRHKNLL